MVPDGAANPALHRVLVIDDDELVRGTVALMLQRGGFEVTEACTAAEGLRRQAEAPADVVVTDLRMPGGGVAEAIERIRQDKPEVKVFVMSGAASALEDGTPSCLAGVPIDGVLAKPFTAVQLLEKIRGAL
jgi:CheY-like chemotaxis protein